MPGDEGVQSICIHVIHHFGPDGTVPAGDPEHGLSLRASPPFRPMVPDEFPFVLPLSCKVGFIDLNRSGEDIGNVLREGSPHTGECPQNPFPFNRSPQGDVLAALFQQEPPDDLLLLIPAEGEREPMRNKLIPAMSAPSFP